MDDQSYEQAKIASLNISGELKLFKIAAQKAPFAVSISDENNKHVFQNRSFNELFGYEFLELKDKTLKTIYSDPNMYEIAMDSFSCGKSWSAEVDMIPKDGKIIPVMVNTEAAKDSDDKIIGSIAYFSDLSAVKRKEYELDCQKEYLSTLHSISLGIFRRIDLSELLNVIVLKIARITQASGGFLYLYNSRNNELELKTGCGSMADFIGGRVQSGNGLVGTIFKKGEPVIIDAFQKEDEMIKDSIFASFSAVMGIPVISGSKIKGVIGICYDMEDIKLDPNNISVLEEFSAIANIAIDSAHLFESQKETLGKKMTMTVPVEEAHVLFVDDEPSIAEIGKRLLEKLNYKVTALTGSREALEIFSSAPDDFDVVVTDMSMPEMTGEKLAEELKKIRSDIPVILCTGHQQYASKQELLERNLDYICSKPISRDMLATAVRNAVDGKK